mmetsp:Transcript_29220/g.38920  ORF Transcript_29220/g.38920 Transcript_29220/m.38920 type:complete len:127 (-) Transcript_29220:1672-2052(-)
MGGNLGGNLGGNMGGNKTGNRMPTEQNISMIMGTDGHFDTQDNMLRQDVVQIVQDEEEQKNTGLLTRLSARSASQKDGYKAVEDYDLDIKVPESAHKRQNATGTENFARSGKGKIDFAGSHNLFRR